MTPYHTIYNRFLRKVTDYKMTLLEEDDALSLWKDWLHSAVSTQRIVENYLTMNDEEKCFTEDLLDIEIEMLAMGMCIAWLEPQIQSITNTMQMFGGKEEKFYSQANHLAELRAMKKDLEASRKRIARDYQYSRFSRSISGGA